MAGRTGREATESQPATGARTGFEEPDVAAGKIQEKERGGGRLLVDVAAFSVPGSNELQVKHVVG